MVTGPDILMIELCIFVITKSYTEGRPKSAPSSGKSVQRLAGLVEGSVDASDLKYCREPSLISSMNVLKDFLT